MMKTAFTTVALGAALLLTGSWGAGAQEGLFTSERDCTTDVSPCARASARRRARSRLLAVPCQRTLRGLFDNSVEGHLGRQECAGDIHQFCPTATFGTVSDCMRPHLGEASDTCKSALAFMASPAADRIELLS